MSEVICGYCNNPAALVGGDTIYPHRQDLKSKLFYLCKPCDAYVGCHPGTSTPLGTLADLELRRARSIAHNAFDPIWRSRLMSRTKAYKWLAHALNIDHGVCHIGMFDAATCKKVVALSIAKKMEMA